MQAMKSEARIKHENQTRLQRELQAQRVVPVDITQYKKTAEERERLREAKAAWADRTRQQEESYDKHRRAIGIALNHIKR